MGSKGAVAIGLPMGELHSDVHDWQAKIEVGFRSLCDTVEELRREAADRSLEIERLSELLGEVATLRTELHLQAAASSAVALKFAGNSNARGKRRTLQALHDRAKNVNSFLTPTDLEE